MKLNRLTLLTAVLAVVFTLTGCDDEFSDVGGEIINNPTDVSLREVEVNSYSRRINSIQTNNLSNLALGTHKDDIYGETTASIVSQLSLGLMDPDFGDNVELDSVVLTIPYYSEETTDTEGETIYELDSIFGTGSFNLAIYETSFFLNEYDPEASFEQREKYYSDQQAQIENNIVELLYEKENFQPSKEPYQTIEIDEIGDNDTLTKAPALRVKLPVEYFQKKIIDKVGSEELLNNFNFKNYFRSIYIKAESNSSEGVQALLNLGSDTEANIRLYYTYDTEEDDETVNKRGTFDLDFYSPSTVNNQFNVYTGEFSEALEQQIAAQDSVEDAENLYLKGQEGSMAIIDLFPNQEVLTELRANDWLINEANLIFYVNQDERGIAEEPERLLLYDVENNQLLIDYYSDPLVSSTDPLNSAITFAPRLERGEDGKGVYYKFRITQYVNEILNNDLDASKLGLVVTGNINVTGFSAVQGLEDVSRVPAGDLLTPRGTVLYGSGAENEDKRLKLQIYYTDYN
ncbi:MAG: DUF4270 domain-containing protein [Christiangramia sp.]|uniref:DUF4270 domain-containing protein n=1 Tax=Christiangramia sp. TaxID=1931228 RepID=UPI003242C1FB